MCYTLTQRTRLTVAYYVRLLTATSVLQTSEDILLTCDRQNVFRDCSLVNATFEDVSRREFKLRKTSEDSGLRLAQRCLISLHNSDNH